ncbi:hypothetical protein [Nostoc piscinale]|nr:hypothetical protein [Nostoc piscinale]
MLTLLELLYSDFGRAIAYDILCERIQYARTLGYVDLIHARWSSKRS